MSFVREAVTLCLLDIDPGHNLQPISRQALTEIQHPSMAHSYGSLWLFDAPGPALCASPPVYQRTQRRAPSRRARPSCLSSSKSRLICARD